MEFVGFSYKGLEGVVVPTTADIPSQERLTNTPTLHFLLPIICQRLTGHNLPRELSEHIVHFLDLGMTREQAETHRRALMRDRKVTNSDAGNVRLHILSLHMKDTDLGAANMGGSFLSLRALALIGTGNALLNFGNNWGHFIWRNIYREI